MSKSEVLQKQIERYNIFLNSILSYYDHRKQSARENFQLALQNLETDETLLILW
jgi:hypothetical protein